jgi:sulfatase maturation enzyme AslB (radical SAM superfamily)
MTDSVCAALWSHGRVDVSLKVYPCCRWRPAGDDEARLPHISNGIESAINSGYFDNVRKRMLAGKVIPQCKQCTNEEAVGVTSMRNRMNESYSKHINSKPKIRDLELAFSTQCNLACRMCGPTASSKWELIVNPGIKVDTSVIANELSNFDHDWSELDNIKMVGGEPFLAKDHYKYLEYFVTQAHRPEELTLVYHTNGTIFPNKNIIDYWKKIKKVRIVLSVDAYGKLNNYLRPGQSDWETINANLDKFKNISGVNVEIGTHSVISNISALHLYELVDWLDKTVDFNNSSFDVLVGPYHLSIMHLVESEKSKIKEHIELVRKDLSHINELESKVLGIVELALLQHSTPQFTLEDIAKQEKQLDKYFKQDFYNDTIHSTSR